MKALILAIATASALFSQTPPKDADTIRDLLVEVRALRHALEANTAASQRVQIVLYNLQSQQASVTRAYQRADSFRSRRTDQEAGLDRLADEIRRGEEAINQAGNDPLKKTMQDRLHELKPAQERQRLEIQRLQGLEAEANTELRNELAKLAELQAKLEKLDQSLTK